MLSAHNKLYKRIATPILGVAFLLLNPIITLAFDTTVGEYLYTDEYLPDTSATCTLNVKNPDGSANITNQSLTATADAWYGHTFTSPTTVGYYRSEICCDVNGDHMCIDKSFSIDPETSSGTALSASDVATSVWGYSDKTLTGFNNLVSDIWGYATRTLTSGTNIVNTTTTTEVTQINKTAAETRLLLEQLVNKPIIENTLEEVSDLDLGERVEESKKIANEAYMNLLFVGSTISKTNKSWNELTDRQILDNLVDVSNLLGDESDSTSSNSFFARVNYLRDTWGTKESDDLYEEIKAIKNSVNYVSTGVSSYGKSKALQKEIASVSAYVASSEKVLSQINKKINEVESLSKVIDSNLSEVNSVLGSWTTDSYLDVKSSVDTLYKNIIAINKIPKGQIVLDSVYPDITGEKKLKNKVLGLRALLLANKKMLLGGQKLAFSANWMEEGSIVIKTLITNPSNLISQEVPLKYYLPKESKKEHVVDSDAGTEIKYDTEKDQLYVEGNFLLKPGETRTIKVRLEDVWQISEAEIDSLLSQAEELAKPLEKTAFFAQGITLKSDIDVSLSKARDLLKDGITPESKIKSYREAEIEISSSKEKIEKLKDIVSQAQSSGSILGFVGGSQAIVVWGIVIAVATAFVFMTVYMRKIMGLPVHEGKVQYAKNKTNVHHSTNFDKVAVFLVVATISGLLSSISVKKFVIPTVRANTKQEVLGRATVDYKQLKVVELVAIEGVVKIYQDEGSETVLELIDSGKSAIEVERGEKRVRVVYEGKDVWVSVENVMAK
ncbi:MAG: hypothetical protein AAB778_02920 [Patescibacteria group bacterium]